MEYVSSSVATVIIPSQDTVKVMMEDVKMEMSKVLNQHSQ
jgi:hypothetical protein